MAFTRSINADVTPCLASACVMAWGFSLSKLGPSEGVGPTRYEPPEMSTARLFESLTVSSAVYRRLQPPTSFK